MTSPETRTAMRRRARHLLSGIGVAVALIYFVLVGGTSASGGLPIAQIVNVSLAAILVVMYVWTAPRLSDHLDQLMLVALLLFLATGVVSTFPRQSLDAAMSALAYAALFF